MDIGAWLRDLGLERYEQAFRENDIASAVLPELTDRDLKDLGVSLGHRRLLLKAIADLAARDADAALASAAEAAPRNRPSHRSRAAAADGDVLSTWSARPSCRRGSIPRTWAR